MASLAEDKRVYWDSCVWIALIDEESGRVDRCQSQIRQATGGSFEILTSSLTLAEVYKFKCGSEAKALAIAKDAEFEKYLRQRFVVQIQLDHAVGTHARRLLRQFSALKKPNDAVHLASAALNNADTLYTFDSDNLIPLHRKIQRADGQLLNISEPPPPIIDQQPQLPLHTPDPEKK
jgi:predicted nucleic acid-binding protein